MSSLHKNGSRLLNEVTKKGKALIIPHLIADVDALASACVMAKILKRRDVDVGIYIESISPLSPRNIYKYIKKSRFLKKTGGYIIIVDTSSKDFVPELKEEPFAIIDHHHSIDKLNAKIELIDEDALSTTEIIWKVFGNEIKEKDALFLAAGFYSDTFGLHSLINAKHLNHFNEMVKRSGIKDISKIKELALKRPPVAARDKMTEALKGIETLKIGKHLIGYLFHDSIWAVEIADLLSKTGLYDAVFVVKDRQVIYFRSNNALPDNAMRIIRETMKELDAKGGANKWRGVMRLKNPMSKDQFKNLLESKLLAIDKK